MKRLQQNHSIPKFIFCGNNLYFVVNGQLVIVLKYLNLHLMGLKKQVQRLNESPQATGIFQLPKLYRRKYLAPGQKRSSFHHL